jgi:hypothetical protein
MSEAFFTSSPMSYYFWIVSPLRDTNQSLLVGVSNFIMSAPRRGLTCVSMSVCNALTHCASAQDEDDEDGEEDEEGEEDEDEEDEEEEEEEVGTKRSAPAGKQAPQSAGKQQKTPAKAEAKATPGKESASASKVLCISVVGLGGG